MGDFYNRGGGSLVLTDLEVDGTTIVVDETNDRVGIGTATPTHTLDVDGTFSVDGAGVSIDSVGVAANFTVASDGAGEDLTIAVTGATDSSVVISSTGTGADAINIDTTAGSIDIDSADNITVGAADEISITTTSVDGHITLTSAHTAGVAFHIDANANAASEVQIDAGILDVDVTGVASIDSVGMDINAGSGTLELTTSGAVDINGAVVTVDGTTLSLDGTDSTNLTMTANSSSAKALTIDAVNSGSGVASITLGTTSGTAVSIGHTTSETTVNDNLTVTGDLTVNGTTTTINSTTLTVDDLLIEVASGAADSNAANGAGISIDGADATITYAHTGTKFVMNKPLDVTGAITATSDMSIAASKAYKVGSTAILSDSSGTMTLSNIDALDATTEATIEAAIDTLSNLTTVGTIGTGTWQGTAVASAYLDADTAHLSGTQTFTGTKTLNSFKGTGGATVTNILDEDAMGSDSATALATQQSIKAYADTKSALAGSSSITTVGTVAAGTWQGTAIASAYLDADTAHLTTNQTLSGEKTFTADLVVTTANHSVTVDVSADEMILAGDTKLSFNDANGGENISADAGGTLVVNAGAILDAVAPTIDLNASTKIIVNSPIMQMFSGTSARPLMSLECTNPDALGGTLQFVKDGASVADNDVVGTIKFVSEDDTSPDPVVQTYATIESTISDMTAGSEGGSISISVASHDGELQPGLTLQDGNAEDEIDVFIANGAASVTTVAGLLSVTSGVALEEASSLEIIAPLLPTNDHASSGIIALMLAGGAIAAFQTVCAHTTTGEVVITDSNAIATMPVIGIAPVAISDTATGPIMLQGFIRDDTWTWTIGGIMYASETAGAMTQTAPTTSGAFVQALGVAISADVVYFNPSLTLVEVA
jgi:hypothetical protein